MSKAPIPKYAAVPGDGEEAIFAGEGDTPDLAVADFIIGEYDNYCDCYDHEDDLVRLTVWKVCRPGESDWPVEEIDPNWNWVLNSFVEERIVSAAEHAS